MTCWPHVWPSEYRCDFGNFINASFHAAYASYKVCTIGMSSGPANLSCRWREVGGGRNGLLHKELCGVANLFAAWARFRKGKRARPDVMAYERNLEANLFALQEELADGSYRHAPCEPFIVCDPKRREINKATVRDRVVHQAVINV